MRTAEMLFVETKKRETAFSLMQSVLKSENSAELAGVRTGLNTVRNLKGL